MLLEVPTDARVPGTGRVATFKPTRYGGPPRSR
jgi:hypothetical protein